jgi:hypothetical protein
MNIQGEPVNVHQLSFAAWKACKVYQHESAKQSCVLNVVQVPGIPHIPRSNSIALHPTTLAVHIPVRIHLFY